MVDYGKRGVTQFSYRTGRLFFHVLYAVLGEDAFDRILGAYFRAFRASGSTTEEFVQFVESHATVPLQPVFQDWLYTTNWAARLDAEEPLDRIIDSYRRH
jgi:aminopeptidase N